MSAAVAPSAEVVSEARLRAAFDSTRAQLLAERRPQGHWEGELSSSALSTATAVGALALFYSARGARLGDAARFARLTSRGLRWILAHQNHDGGWGDTVRSRSNVSTTLLCRSAIALAGSDCESARIVERAEAYLRSACGGGDPARWAAAVRERYGSDRTFSVPILSMAALAGITKWEEVPALPFELACVPSRLYRLLSFPVVSYALPALIALGIVRFRRGSPPPAPFRLLRQALTGRALAKLAAIQPTHGGFLEATPLVSFVTMALCGAGMADHVVARRAAGFLERSARADGSWPIDTNLATWVTTLSVEALALEDDPEIRGWLLAQQHRAEHPYTCAAPGGWGWTPLEGGVPDADDTSGALVALHRLGPTRRSSAAAERGARWLLDLQNRDGGWPTFCRGWGTLPFDRSSPDITAHAIRALAAWRAELPSSAERAGRAIERGFAFLERSQLPDGSWIPLWFGNQDSPDDSNPTYGTARVLDAYRATDRFDAGPARRARRWLAAAQNHDGGWGGSPGAPSSTEETALALQALAGGGASCVVDRGLAWLCGRVEDGTIWEAAPIGLYFAKLWYFEKLYPLIFTVGALRRALSARGGSASESGDANV